MNIVAIWPCLVGFGPLTPLLGHCASSMGRKVASDANGTSHPPCSVGEDSSASKTDKSTDVAAIVVPILFVLLVTLGVGFIVLYTRHRRLQSSFTAFANSHYSSRLGSAIFSSGDDLGTWNLGILVGNGLVWKIPLWSSSPTVSLTVALGVMPWGCRASKSAQDLTSFSCFRPSLAWKSPWVWSGSRRISLA